MNSVHGKATFVLGLFNFAGGYVQNTSSSKLLCDHVKSQMLQVFLSYIGLRLLWNFIIHAAMHAGIVLIVAIIYHIQVPHQKSTLCRYATGVRLL